MSATYNDLAAAQAVMNASITAAVQNFLDTVPGSKLTNGNMFIQYGVDNTVTPVVRTTVEAEIDGASATITAPKA